VSRLTLHARHAGHGGHGAHAAHVHPRRRHELARHARHGGHLVVVARHGGGEVAHAHSHAPSSVQSCWKNKTEVKTCFWT